MVVAQLGHTVNVARRLLSDTALQSCRKSTYRQLTSQTHYRSGGIKPIPTKAPFGVVGIFCSVIPGLFVGAAISKSVANFLEENDLFVPSEDDDDDDD